ncbi:MAG: branched-chain amino acid transaminase [Thermomicrobiales bacterium]
MSIGASHPKFMWWNGELVPWEKATVHVTQMHWTAVSAIFEGIMSYWNQDQEELYVFRLDGHLKRFVRSQKMMRMRADYTVEQLTDAITGLLRANDTRTDTYVFPYAYPAGGGRFRSFSASEPGAAEVQVTTRPSSSHLLSGKMSHACVSSWTRIPDNVMPPRIKNIANYRNGGLAGAEAAINGYDTAILLNTAGKVAEGPGACIMMVRDGQLITPTVTDSILESITRSAIIELARDLGVEVVERTIDRTELYIADEVFFCGTAAEITPVASVDRYTVGNGELGPITGQLEQKLHDIMRGKDSRYASWATPVGVPKAVPTD